MDGAAKPHIAHDWRAGAHVVSEASPRLLLFPCFLSQAETEHLLSLARMRQDSGLCSSRDTNGRTISVSLPQPCDDPVISAIEERCAAATGIPVHPDEEPLGMRHTNPATATECSERMCTALHVDTNQGGYFRCATVLVYLHDIEIGGETRFPLLGAAEDSDLRAAAERLAGLGVTAFNGDEDVEWPPIAPRRILMDAAENSAIGLHVKPKRGLACVFWTHTANGLDPCSWHVGARLPPEQVEGKLLAQKFKALPIAHQLAAKRSRGGKVMLPAELLPPQMPA